MSARLLIIALDGADSRRLEAWSDDGGMPNLARLRERGVSLRLDAPPWSTDDSLWASFQYGVDTATHGRPHYAKVLSSGRVGMAMTEEGELDTFWRGLSEKGMRLAVLDVPKCAAPRAINGLHLADWLVHGRYFDRPMSYPASLAQEVVSRFGPAPPSQCGYNQRAPSDERVRDITGALRVSLAQKGAAALHYLAAEPWDLFVVGFKEAHCAGHGLWNFADRDHPEFDAARSARLGWPIRQVFEGLDAAIGELCSAAGPDAEIVVFSTTNMAPNGSIDQLTPQVIMRLNAVLSGRPATALERAGSSLAAHLPGRLARRLSTVLEPSRPGRLAAAVVEQAPWSDDAAALKLRAGGPADQARLFGEIESLLRELVDEQSGRQVVSDILYPSADQRGARSDALPDCLVRYRAGLTPRAIRSPRLGRITARYRRRRPGNHAEGSLAVLAGARAMAGAARLKAMEDFAPFVDEVLGGPRPRRATDAQTSS
jgi:hypothetical protein